VQQEAVQVGDIEPETSALCATEEESVLSVGELGHLRIVARAIHKGLPGSSTGSGRKA
jgi:hypothetical protein